MMPCQWTSHRPCEMPGAYTLTFRSKHGFEWIEVQCRSHCDGRTDQIRAEGGEIVAAEDIPQPAPIVPEPVGLDAVDPPAPVEKPVRVPRRRHRAAGSR